MTVIAKELPSNFDQNYMDSNLAGQLRHYLEKFDMTATQLAKKSRVPKQSLSGWLNGSNPRDIRQVKQVATVFGITVDHLMFGTGSSYQEPSLDVDTLIGDEWLSGMFEIKIRRVKRNG